MPTIREIVSLYLRHSIATGKHCTEALLDRERTLGLFVDLHGDLPVTEAKAYHLSDWIEAHERWKSVSTRRAKASMVRACFQWAFKGERIDRNPFANVNYEESERRPELTDQCFDVVTDLANKPYERALRWLRLTGCRLSEMAEALWQDVDLGKGVWTIPKHKSRKKTKRPKIVALVPAAVDLLRELPAVTIAEAMPLFAALAAPGIKPGDFIFLNTKGTAWNRRTMGQQLLRMKERFGIQTKASLHGIRHRAATAAIAAGAPIKLVSEQLGHSTSAVTERYYWHASDEHVDAMRDAISKGLK